ncbi:MAG: DUF2125 domain-containing protein [Pseudomonadota bacterium]
MLTAKPMRAAIAALLVLALLAAGHSALWRWTSGQIERGFASWAAQRRAQGWTVEHGATTRGGWPFAATLNVPGLRMAATMPNLPGGFDWQAEAVALRVAAPRLDRLVVDLRGRQRLRLGETELPFAADRLEAFFPTGAGNSMREGEVQTERLRMSTPSGLLELREGTLAFGTRTSATESEPALTLNLAMRGLGLPEAIAALPALAAFGRQVDSMVAEAVVSGPVPGGRDPVLRAEQWRDGGGTAEFRLLSLQWGPVGGGVNATVTLDDRLQPMGTATLRMSGADRVIRALAEAGTLTPASASAAATALMLLQRAPENGGPPQVEVPMTLEGSRLTVARVPLARLEPIPWPQRRGADISPGEDPTLPPRR